MSDDELDEVKRAIWNRGWSFILIGDDARLCEARIIDQQNRTIITRFGHGAANALRIAFVAACAELTDGER